MFDTDLGDIASLSVVTYRRTANHTEVATLSESADWDPDGKRCQTIDLADGLIVDETMQPLLSVRIRPGRTVDLTSVRWNVVPTDEPATEETPARRADLTRPEDLPPMVDD